MRCAYLLFLGLLLSLTTEAVPQNCPEGFVSTNKKCKDENECEFENPICGDNAVCYNTNGSYYCQCELGYQEPSGKVNFTQEESKGCKDVNECSKMTDFCGPNSKCTNTPGSYFCTCKEGFVSSNGETKFYASQGVTCKDVNECSKMTDFCGPNSKCTNTPGSYFCTCKEGFVSSNGEKKFYASQGVTCTDVNECSKMTDFCGPNSNCTNTPGSYFCTCKEGFVSSNGEKKFNGSQGVTCTDVNECSKMTDFCGPNSKCTNTPGSYFCTCKEGFVSSNGEKKFNGSQGVTCKDVNECSKMTDFCGPNSNCTNTPGSYFCTCKEGFVSSNGEKKFNGSQGVTCKDENECEFEDPICGENAVCYNTNGNYYCQCELGYQEASGKVNFTQEESKGCRDMNECSKMTDFCGPNSKCTNTPGSYFCTCKEGFVSSNGETKFNASQGVTCNDENECEFENPICGDNAVCYNTNGNYYCQCELGYQEPSGKVNFTQEKSKGCKDVCTRDESLCGEGDCNKSEDGHECVCKKGFTNYGFKTMKCTKPNNGLLSQYYPEVPQLLPVMEELRNSFQKLSGDQDMSKRVSQMDGNTLLERFLNALDELLSAGPLNNNKKVTTVLEITENFLKVLGPLLSNITKSSACTEVNTLLWRDNAPPHGPFILSTSDTQLESHWETAAGDSYKGFAAVSLLSYNSLENSVNNYFNHIKIQEDETLKINSKVVTAVVTNPDTAQLRERIILTFSHLQQPSDRNQTCVFWDSSLDGGVWSTNGCSVVSSDANHTVCSCSHLSSFAVLMALHEIKDVFQLKLITWVGLSLSLICLFICILTFHFVRSIQSTRTTIHLHLCISLFIANLVFLAGITQTQNEVCCSIVAILLHFFFLAALCWMCLEGVQLFNMVVLVFNTTVRPLYLMLGGYGVPALIVIISASINARGYGTKRHCWLNLKDGFIWSFFGPVCIIIVVNVFFFLITVWKLAEKFSFLNQDLSKLQKIKSFTITAIAQLCVLGTMWIFGCFQFEGGSLVMSYLFTIFNSLQGVLVFVMHCLLSKQVREEYARILTSLCAPQKKKYSEFSTNQSSKSQASRSIQHTGESNI
ncbi:adhesion G protein-coupled receptor E2-like isoform X4 [Pygocentrus nattereri]|uniref:Si:ch211-241f5.3 n=1 Tax=Pygocentrus nattereri TaxID=42514 RepID=A0A3B4E0U9_PYGNA|nr:adhesion G protein-coupled receptor E2-like isoform X4 [Pygocentrus nattereri]